MAWGTDLGEKVGRWWGRVASLDAAKEREAEQRQTSSTIGPAESGLLLPRPILMPLRAQAANGAQTLPKPTAVNLRRLAETPAARRAINCIKDRIASMEWRIEPRPGLIVADPGQTVARIQRLTFALQMPNESDSFRTLIEPVIEDVLVGGFGAVELRRGSEELPVRLYGVDGATIQLNPEWRAGEDEPRYAQATGQAARIPLRDEELMYVRLNPRTHSIFGLGKMEVAFEAINSFLGAHRYAGRMAGNSTVQYALWMKDRTPEQQERLTRWWQEEVEGSGRVPVLGTEEPPQVVKLAGGTDAELRLEWQNLLLTMVANAFDLPPMMLGVTHDVNRSTAQEMADEAFQNAVVPLAKLLADYITRDVIVKLLGWHDLRFVWNELESRDEEAEASIQIQLLQAGVLNVDEVRAMRGLPARPLPPAAAETDESGQNEQLV